MNKFDKKNRKQKMKSELESKHFYSIKRLNKMTEFWK